MIQFPSSTIVNKLVPKTAFYKHLELNNRLKTRFVEDVERIVWSAKIAPSTLPIEDGAVVHEIVVFTITIKNEDIPDDVFIVIDKQMPRHVVFVLQYGDKGRLLLNYKEPIEGTKSVYNIVKTIRSAWLPLQDIELIIKGSSLDNIYEAMAGQILGFGTITSDDTKRIIALQDEIAKKQRAAEALQKKVRTERQFSRQMEYNTEARVLKQEIKKLQEELKQFDRK
jgi:hypothetical protein